MNPVARRLRQEWKSSGHDMQFEHKCADLIDSLESQLRESNEHWLEEASHELGVYWNSLGDYPREDFSIGDAENRIRALKGKP